MTKVFVHGNPESADIWHPLIAALVKRGVDDIVTLSPPGFGASTPEGWRATRSNYIAWLADELARIEGPVDLLGHDWGAGHVFGLAATHPELIRSYAADCAGLLHPDYVWHDAAQGWQTDEVGEQMIDMMLAQTGDERTATYVGLGLTPAIAAAMAAACNAEMGRCILELYRDALQPGLIDLGNALDAADRRPSLLLNATADAYVQSSLVPDVAARLDAVEHRLEGQGHWWMASDPGGAADALANFWSSLD